MAAKVAEERAWFVPKGEVPEWRLLYDRLLATAEFGQVITYAQLDEALGRPFRDNRAPLYRALQEMGVERKRWLVPVPNVGYRVLLPGEHMAEARGRKRRAFRQFEHMKNVTNATAIELLSAEELKLHEAQARYNVLVLNILVRHESRLLRVEDILARAGLE